jgi:hypothetical protein
LTVCILGIFCVFYLQWRHTLALGQALIVLLCLLITTGKVFSPQYLIWLIPLVAYVGAARWWLAAWVVVSLCTTAIYLFYYPHLTDPAAAPQIIQTLPGFFEIIIVRNMLFLFITLAYLFNWFQARQLPASRKAQASSALAAVAALPDFVRSKRL